MNAVVVADRPLARLMRLGVGVPLAVLALLVMLVVPLPPLALDVLFTFNIALSLMVLMVALYALRPLDFAVFPTVLLAATLLRLALNVASTRVVLMHGHAGTDAAGHVIEAFGAFVMGGNAVVGMVVFAILIIINFVVITRGAGRVAEVSARFTLDAMPGRQMAIDADLGAGVITQAEAATRRDEVRREADFYGSMDGAGKFVRGDAVAGILILAINLIGGIAIGMGQHGLAAGEAAHTYSLLTVGDGLVAQLPALLLSVAAAVLVTRVSRAQPVNTQITEQLLAHPAALGVSGALIGALGLVPGMPNLVFLVLGGGLGYAAYRLRQRRQAADAGPGTVPGVPGPDGARLPAPKREELGWDDVAPVDLAALEVGFKLIALVDRTRDGELLARIRGVRRKLSQELGFLIAPVHIRDNLSLPPGGYRIVLTGAAVAQGEVHPDRLLAIDPGGAGGALVGIATRDPSFGLPAWWIEPAQREAAQMHGYTVVDAATVVATHLSQVLQANAADLLGHEELQQLLDRLAQSAPRLVESLVPKALTHAAVLRVLRNLLREGVAVRDLRTIVESLAEHAPRSQEPDVLTAHVRVALRRAIVHDLVGTAPVLDVTTLDPELERLLLSALQGGDSAGLEPTLAQRLRDMVAEAARRQEQAGQVPVVLVPGALRLWLARFARAAAPALRVLGYEEIPESREVRVVASIGGRAAA